jgi:hypothetical protein
MKIIIKELLEKIIKLICNHKYVCTYIYNTSAEWRCVKCGKRKKGMAPIGLSKTEIDYNNNYFKMFFNK